MGKAVSVIEATLNLDASQWEATIKRAADSAEGFVTDTQALMAGLAAGMGAVTATFSAATLGLKVMGDQVLEIRKNLSGAFSGAELDGVAERIREIASLQITGLDVDELVEGAKRLGTFSDDVAKDLERVANVAAKTGESFGSLKDYFAEFTVNAGAQDTLREIANITPGDLVRFGATLDSTGERILTMGKHAESAQKALRGVVDEKYSGSLEKMSSNTDKLRSELQLLAQDAGTAVATLSNKAAGALLPLVTELRELPVEVKAAVGTLTGLTSVVSGIGATGLTLALALSQIAANFKTLGGAGKTVTGLTGALAVVGGISKSATTDVLALTGTAKGLTSGLTAASGAAGAMGPAALAMSAALDPAAQATVSLGTAARAAALNIAAMVAPFAAVALAAGTVLVVGNKLIKQSSDRAAAERKAIDAQKDALKIERDRLDVLGKSTKQLYDEGKTAADMLGVLEAYRTALDSARRSSNEATAQTIEEFLADAQAQYDGLKALEDRDRGRAAARNPVGAADGLEEALKNIALLRAQNKITVEEEFAQRRKAIREHVDDEKEQRLALKDLEIERINATNQAGLDAVEKEKQEREKASQEAFNKEMDRIRLLLTQRKISQKQAFDLEEKALDRFNRPEAEERSLTQRRAEQEIADEDEVAKAIEASRKDKLERELARIEILRAENKISAEKERELLFKVLGTHALTAGEREKIVKRRAVIEQQERDKIAAAEKAAREKAKAEQEQADKEALDLAEKRRDDLADAQARGRDIRTAEIDRSADALVEQSKATGKDNSFPLRQLLQERLALEEESLRLEYEKLAAATDSAAVRAQLEANLQGQIRAEQLETAEAYQAALDEMAKAHEEHTRRKRGESSFSGPFGIEDLNTNMQATLAQSVRDRGPSLTSFAALPSVLQPRRPDDFIPGIAGGGVLAGVGEAVGQAVSKALAPVEQRVKVDVAVSDDRVRASATTVNGQGGDLDRAARGQRISRGPR